MTITTFIDPAKLPNQSQDQATFDNFVAQFFAQLPSFGNQVNAEVALINTLLASLSAVAAGGAYAIPYVYSADSGLGSAAGGKIGFSPDTGGQSDAAVLLLDIKDASGKAVAALIDSMVAGATSGIKGQIRVVKQSDPSKYIVFNAYALSTVGGGAVADRRAFNVSMTARSSVSPFSVGDPLLMFFQRTGDKGETGLQGLNGRSWVLADTGLITGNPVNIDYLNVFSDAYDSYTIEYEAVRPSASASGLLLKFAVGGVLTTGIIYSVSASSNNGSVGQLPSTRDSGLILAPSSSSIGTTLGVIGRTHIRNVRNGGANAYATMEHSVISAADAAAYWISNFTVAQLGNKASGFRLYWAGGQAFAGGRIRVIGHRNS